MDWKSVTFESNGEVKSDGTTYASLADLVAEKNDVKVHFSTNDPGLPGTPSPAKQMQALLDFLNTNASFMVSMAVAESVDRDGSGDDVDKAAGKV